MRSNRKEVIKTMISCLETRLTGPIVRRYSLVRSPCSFFALAVQTGSALVAVDRRDLEAAHRRARPILDELYRQGKVTVNAPV